MAISIQWAISRPCGSKIPTAISSRSSPAEARVARSTRRLRRERLDAFRHEDLTVKDFGLGDHDALAGLEHAAGGVECVAFRGLEEVDLELDGDDVFAFRDNAARGASGDVVRQRRDHARVRESMLLPMLRSHVDVRFAPSRTGVVEFDPEMNEERSARKDAAHCFSHSLRARTHAGISSYRFSWMNRGLRWTST